MTNTRATGPGETEIAPALIVEDDEEMRALLKSLLIDLGYKQTFGVGRLEPALERLKYDSFSLAIVDLNLGEQDGVALIAAIRSSPHLSTSMMPILVASTAVTGQRIQSALRAGADAFLSKPFSVANLKRQIRFACAKAQARGNKRPPPHVQAAATAQPDPDVFVLD